MATVLRNVTPDEPERESESDDRLLAALLEAAAVFEDVTRASRQLVDNAQALIAERRRGRAWEAILSEEESPRFSALLADCADAVGRVNSSVRRVEVDVLYESGMAMHRIGALMGITRQRVAVLLNAAAEAKGKALQ